MMGLSAVFKGERLSVYHSVYPNVAKIPYRRVGCAHQKALNLTVEGGRTAHPAPKHKNQPMVRSSITIPIPIYPLFHLQP